MIYIILFLQLIKIKFEIECKKFKILKIFFYFIIYFLFSLLFTNKDERLAIIISALFIFYLCREINKSYISNFLGITFFGSLSQLKNIYFISFTLLVSHCIKSGKESKDLQL